MENGVEKKRLIVLGQRWCSPDGTSWKVVSVWDSDVLLSGPGPCRGTKIMPSEELLARWSLRGGA
jgi:hypothetical protein